eukprot:scaffold2298_cov388-Prasinococcus_capsulatus_cf.AAC.6
MELELDAIRGQSSAHSFATGPVTAEPARQAIGKCPPSQISPRVPEPRSAYSARELLSAPKDDN